MKEFLLKIFLQNLCTQNFLIIRRDELKFLFSSLCFSPVAKPESLDLWSRPCSVSRLTIWMQGDVEFLSSPLGAF